jgi:hypothetical protein
MRPLRSRRTGMAKDQHFFGHLLGSIVDCGSCVTPSRLQIPAKWNQPVIVKIVCYLLDGKTIWEEITNGDRASGMAERHTREENANLDATIEIATLMAGLGGRGIFNSVGVDAGEVRNALTKIQDEDIGIPDVQISEREGSIWHHLTGHSAWQSRPAVATSRRRHGRGWNTASTTRRTPYAGRASSRHIWPGLFH